MSTSTPASTSIPATNFSAIFEVAFKEYQNRTGQDLRSHPFAISLEINNGINSPDAILEVFRRQAQAFDKFRGRDDKLMACLAPIVNILFTLSATLGEGIGLPFSPAKIIFTGIGILLGTVKDIIASYEKLVQLFERIHFFLQRLNRYTGMPLPPDMIHLLGKIMAQVLSVLAHSTKAMKERRTKKFLKRLVGRTDVEDAFERLDMLTKEENLMATARNLEVTHRVDDNVKANLELNHHIVNKVTAVEEAVYDVRDNVEVVQGDVCNIKDSVTLTKHVIDETQRNQLREKLTTWLGPPDPSVNHNTACGIQHKGTANWFLESDTFNEWKKDGSVLWIRGNPGSGKTVLCSAIIEDIKRMRRAGSCLIGYYYFDFKDAAKRDVRGLLTSLLKQLVQGSDHCWGALCQLYNSCDDKSEQPSEAVLTECLKAMIELPEQIPIFIFIDALDECPNVGNPSSREKVLNFLEDLVGSNHSNLHICITSRPEHDILSTLSPLTLASRRVSLHEEDGQTEDINSYIRSFVYTNRTMRRWKAEDQELVVCALTNRAGGMFRWVYCQLDSLSQCFPSSIRSAVMELPTTLDDTYERILQGIPKQKRQHAYRLFQCMIAAFRPLRVEELAEILAIKFDLDAAANLVEGWRPENPEEDVLSACSALIAIIDDNGAKIVQFSHFSVKEFLTSDRLQMSAKEGNICEYYIPLEPAHTILVRACLAILLQLDDKVDKKRLATFPLASYAAQHWVDHAKFGTVAAEVQCVMENFFNPKNPYLRVWAWIFDVGYTVDQARNFSRNHPSALKATPLYYAAVCGFSGLVKHLIVVHTEDVNAMGDSLGSPLHAASVWGHVDAARVLLGYEADVNARRGSNWTPLHCASHSGHPKLVQLLLEHKADVTAKTKKNRTPLIFASLEGHFEVVALLLGHGADVNARGQFNWTPLHCASLRGHPKIVRLFLEHKADVTAQAKDNDTPLFLASLEGHFEVVELLLNHGADVNARGQFNWTPLHCASWKGDLKIVQLLLEHKADVTAQSKSNETPLFLASQEGHIAVVRLLLRHGADASIPGSDGLTPFQKATKKGHHDIAQLLLERGPKGV